MSESRKKPIVPAEVGRLKNLLAQLGETATYSPAEMPGKGWTCTVTTTVDGKTYSASGESSKKLNADATAAKKLYAKLVSEGVAARAVVKMIQGYGHDFAKALNEVCHILGGNKPTYSDDDSEAAPFDSCCTLTLASGTITGHGTGESKAKARRAAAKHVMVKLGLIPEASQASDQPREQRPTGYCHTSSGDNSSTTQAAT